MIKHCLLMIFRNIKRNKTTFLINLIGLSTGLACALFIFLWINNELHVDKFHEKDKQLYQVMKNNPARDRIHTVESTPGLLAHAMVEELPEVEHAVAVIQNNFLNPKGTISNNGKSSKACGWFASQDYFNIFSYPLIKGDKSQVLNDKNNIVISNQLAQQLFGSTENIIGKTIEWSQKGTSGIYQVSGVFENIPSNSSSRFDVILHYDLFLDKKPNLSEWRNSLPATYVILRKNINIDQFNQKIEGFLSAKYGSSSTLFVHQYSERYLYDQYINGRPTAGRMAYVRLFSLIGFFILVIACINFMNLSTANASTKMKEVGVKKTVGADYKLLFVQYMGEAIFMALLSLLFAFLIIWLLLPQFNMITGKQLALDFNLSILISILGIALFAGVGSGIYPAFYLSGFNPVKVLKGKMSTSLSEIWTRKGLVIFQFSISVILIVSVLVVYKQMEMVQTKNLGFNRDHIIYFENGGKFLNNAADNNYAQKLDNFLLGLKNIPGVRNATNFRHLITGEFGRTDGIFWKGKNDNIPFACMGVGYDFIETLNIELKAGRAFSRDFSADKSSIIFNEIAVKQMGLIDPIGKTINLWGTPRQIIGITKNFYFESLYADNTKPFFFHFDQSEFCSKIMVKLKAGSEREALERIADYFEEHNHGLPFEFRFLDDEYHKLYASEMRIAVLSRYSAVIAILISCLGLFGLATFTARKRYKEIGIRKVLGSSEFGIIYLLSSDFTKMVLAAIIIALPISYFITKNWLEGFAYRIDLEWWYFMGAGMIILLIAWITVGMQTFRAARINPVDCLRNE